MIEVEVRKNNLQENCKLLKIIENIKQKPTK